MKSPFHTLVSVLVVLLVFTAVLVTAQSKPTIRLCHVYDGIDPMAPSMYLHAEAAAAALATEIPEVAIANELLVINRGNSTAAIMESALDQIETLPDGSKRCHAVVGPRLDFEAIAVSPLMELLWISAGAGTSRLSDEKNHALFVRAILSDADVATSITQLTACNNLYRIHTICSGDSHSQSTTSQFVSAFLAASPSNQVRQSLCFGESDDSIIAALETIKKDASTSVVVAPITSSRLEAFTRAVTSLGMKTTHAFLFTRSVCEDPSAQALLTSSWVGAWCIRHDIDESATNRHSTAWSAYFSSGDATSRLAWLAASPRNIDVASTAASLSQPAIAHYLMADSLRLIAEAIAAANATSAFSLENTTAFRDALRNVTVMNASSGTFFVDAEGERDRSGAAIANVGPSSVATVGLAVSASSRPSDLSTLCTALTNRDVFWLGRQDGAPVIPTNTVDAEEPLTILVGVVVGVTVLLVFAGSLAFIRSRNPDLFSRIMGSGFWGLVVSILVYTAGFCFQAYTATELVEAHGDEHGSLVNSMVVFTIVGAVFLCVLLFSLIRHFIYVVGENETAYSMRQSIHWERNVGIATLLSGLFDKLPSLIIITVAIFEIESALIYILLFIVLSFMLGSKTRALKTKFFRTVDASEIKAILDKYPDGISAGMSNEECAAIGDELQQEMPSRHARVLEFARDLLEEMDAKGVTRAEYDTILEPILRQLLCNTVSPPTRSPTMKKGRLTPSTSFAATPNNTSLTEMPSFVSNGSKSNNDGGSDSDPTMRKIILGEETLAESVALAPMPSMHYDGKDDGTHVESISDESTNPVGRVVDADAWAADGSSSMASSEMSALPPNTTTTAPNTPRNNGEPRHLVASDPAADAEA